MSTDITTNLLIDDLEAPPLTLQELAWRRFTRHKMAMLGGIFLILLILYSFGGSLFVDEKYANLTNPPIRLSAPSIQHPFGTDTVGRDVLARTIYGGQISMIIGILAVLIETSWDINWGNRWLLRGKD